jgi:hypothetical protein
LTSPSEGTGPLDGLTRVSLMILKSRKYISATGRYQVGSGEQARSVWFWTAPSDWFLGDDGDILGLVLQLKLGTDVAAHTTDTDTVSERAAEEAIAELAAKARSEGRDVVFYHADGQAVMTSLPVMPVAAPSRTFNYWIRCEFEEGKWWQLDRAQSGSRVAASKDLVVHVLRHVNWLFVRFFLFLLRPLVYAPTHTTHTHTLSAE